jgi:SAM-dependent methyltransferase
MSWSPEEYERLAGFRGDWRDSWWNQDFLGLMAHRWRLDQVGSLLDVGCGVGHWGQRLASFLRPGAEVWGVDVEPRFVEQAVARATELGLAQYRAREGVAEALPFDDGRFDFVTAQTVLIHVPDARVALREMIRVTKPGGCVAVAEPNNLASAVVEMSGAPPVPWSDQEAILRLHHTCEAGKAALGRGNSSVGDLVPGLMAELGFNEIRVHTSDKAAALFPPYDGPGQAVDRQQFVDWYRQDVWPAIGHEADARRLFEAGGGDPSAFDHGWAAVMRFQRRFIEDTERARFHAGRGLVFYLVSGRVPGQA